MKLEETEIGKNVCEAHRA